MSSLQVNIGGQSHDTFCRYKRDVIHTTLHHKHNGRIQLNNIDIIAQQLHVKKKQLIKYLCKYLNLQIHNDLIHSAQVKNQEIENGINAFIEQYVLCSQCRLPELNQEKVCKSCGYWNISQGNIIKASTKPDSEDVVVEQTMLVKTDQKLDKRIAKCIEQLYELQDKQTKQTDIMNQLIYSLFECETEEVFHTLRLQAEELLLLLQ